MKNYCFNNLYVTTRILFFVFFCFPFCSLAQIENTLKLESLQKNGSMFYWNGTPYTGEAIDFDGIKYDKTKLRFDGHYINGQPNGRIKKWFPNYQLEYEENYIMGIKEGKQNYYFDNGKIKKEINYSNGKIEDGQYITYLENGQKEKAEMYKGGQKIGEGFYKNGELYESSIEYFEDGHTKKSEGYTKNGQKDGLWVEWYESGQKNNEGNYKNGKEDGHWNWWYRNGDKKKEVIYENEKLQTIVYENNIDPAFSINVNLKQGAFLFRCLFGIEEDTSYVMVSLNFEKRNEYLTLSDNIIEALKNRFEFISQEKISVYGKKMLEYSIDFNNPVLATIYDNGKSTTELGILGSLNTQVTPGYRGKATVSMKINNLKANFTYFNNTISAKSDITTQNDANTIAPIIIRQEVINKTYQAFRIKTQVGEIIERDRKGKAKTISIECGSNTHIAIGFMFLIFSENALDNVLGKIKVIETQSGKSICKVIEGEDIITDLIQAKKKLTAISIYKL